MTAEAKYPWQQLIAEAVGASSEALPMKIKDAERAVANRLIAIPQPDAEEKIALNRAVITLEVLIAKVHRWADRDGSPSLGDESGIESSAKEMLPPDQNKDQKKSNLV
jgi:hypothetical protein